MKILIKDEKALYLRRGIVRLTSLDRYVYREISPLAGSTTMSLIIFVAIKRCVALSV